MRRKWLWLAFLALLMAFHGEEALVTSASAQAGPQSEILRLVNQVRAGYGLPPFVWNDALAAAAQNQANYMAGNNIYSHTGANGSSPQSRAQAAGYPGRATENIVGGTDLSPNQGVIWWQNSPTHFNTMISQRYIHAGVGFAQGHDQNFYALVVGVPADLAAPGNLEIPVPNDDALVPVAPIQLATPGEDGQIVHTVGAGHSFWAIAARYEIPIEQLYLFNNLNEDSVINPGDKLIIRLADGQEPPPTPTPPASHIVGEGESLWTIAAWYKLSLEELLWLNSIEEDSLVQPGDEVKIRLLPGEQPPPTATPQSMHIVQSGDTAWGISVRYGLTLEELFAFNSLNENSVLTIGDQLLIVSPSPIPTQTPFATLTPTPSATPSPTATVTPTPIITPEAVSEANQKTPVLTNGAAMRSTAPLESDFGRAMVIMVGLVLGVGMIAIIVTKR
jgi:uncharacterized protein YkwD